MVMCRTRFRRTHYAREPPRVSGALPASAINVKGAVTLYRWEAGRVVYCVRGVQRAVEIFQPPSNPQALAHSAFSRWQWVAIHARSVDIARRLVG